MNILMISSTFPYPPTRGGTQVRTFNLLQYLSQRNCLTLVTQRESDVTDEEIQGLRDCVDHLIVFDRPSERRSGRILKKNSAVHNIYPARDTAKCIKPLLSRYAKLD